MAEAHPHVFADVTIKAVFSQDGFTGVLNHWVYDEVYSAAIMASVDADGNGKITGAENESVKKLVLEPIRQSNYFNYVLKETSFLQAGKIESFSAEMKNGKLVLDFKIAFFVPVASDYTMLVIVVSDQTNYIQMTVDMENVDVDAPDAMDVEFLPDNLQGLTMFRAFMSDTEGLFLRYKK
jgi:ABC-type uncharacterized transport system substrate-binding protein